MVAAAREQLMNRDEVRREKAIRCKLSFAYFLKQAWPVIEPSRKLIWGHHMQASCEHLQAIADGHLRRLVVNIAPGHGKSSVFSVAFPAWVWTRNPYERFLCASYAMDLAIRDNRNCRSLIESEWYQSLFADVFAMSGDQNVKSYYENNKRGYRLATAVRGSGTGKRGSGLIIDDPNNAMAGLADIEAVREWFGRTWQSRLNDQDKGFMIVVGQRLHENDLTGHILELGGWEHLNLPTEYEPARKSATAIGWCDPRTEEGQLLCPELLNAEAVQSLKKSLGSMNYAAQYQQSPVPAGGGHFKQRWLRYFSSADTYHELETPEGVKRYEAKACYSFFTVDLAISQKQTADYTVIAVWAVTPERELLLLDRLRERLDNPEQQQQIQLIFQRYHPSYILIENVAYQLAIIQQLLRQGLPVREYKPVKDKVSRATTAAVLYEAGRIYHPKHASWLHEWESELLSFPLATHDDQVDTVSMAADALAGPVASAEEQLAALRKRVQLAQQRRAG